MRKIIQLMGTGGGVTDSFKALCDDGSLWQVVGETWKRMQLPAIPQDDTTCTAPLRNYDSDAAFLTWLHARLQFQHGENPNADYMNKLRTIILAMPEGKTTRNLSSSAADLPKVGVMIEPLPSGTGFTVVPLSDIPGWNLVAYPTYELARKRVDDDPTLELVK